jgi:hypothetical protein
VIYILLEIAGQRSCDLDPMFRQEFCKIFLPRRFENGEITPVDHMNASPARPVHQLPEVGIQFRCTSCEIERLRARRVEIGNDEIDRLPFHHLPAIRSGIDMAVGAFLVAPITEIDLEGFETSASYRRKV